MTDLKSFADPSVQQFLQTREVAVLATLMPDGSPAATPMWFVHAPDALVMISVDGLQKVRNLRRDPRVSVVAETTAADGSIGGVVVRGRAELLAESAERRGLAERFLAKYHPRLERIWAGRVMPPNRVMFRIVVERFRSWGLG
jgi:PPOX class probable F420-dependent enzyme